MEQNVGGTPDESRQPAHSEAQEPVNVQQDTSAAPPVDAAPESAQAQPHPGAETDSAPVGQTQAENTQSPDVSQEASASEEDVAPDADEPGDDVAPEETAPYEQDQPDHPDEVNQEG